MEPGHNNLHNVKQYGAEDNEVALEKKVELPIDAEPFVLGSESDRMRRL